jgi:hypothetical protein
MAGVTLQRVECCPTFITSGLLSLAVTKMAEKCQPKINALTRRPDEDVNRRYCPETVFARSSGLGGD